MSLADWAAWYDSCGKPYIKKSNNLDIDNLPLETNFNDNNEDDEEDENENEKILVGYKTIRRDQKLELYEVFALIRE